MRDGFAAKAAPTTESHLCLGADFSDLSMVESKFEKPNIFLRSPFYTQFFG